MSANSKIFMKILARTAVVLLALILGTVAAGFDSITASADDRPDLIVYDITLSPQEPVLGETVTITVTVKNQGTAAAGLNHVVCFVDETILDTNSISSLAAGTMTTTAFSWTAQAGLHTIKATVDPGEKIPESDENNNTNTFTISTIAPDLIVQSITWTPENPSRGDSIVFSITIKNQGSSRARPCTFNLYIDGNSRGNQDIAGIEPGDTVIKTHNWIALPGQHTVKVAIDENNQVKEGDETNNEYTATFSTLPPDLIVEAVYWDPENPSKNDDITFIATITNQGSGRSDVCQLAYIIDDTYQSYLTVGQLEADTSVNVTFNWTALTDLHDIQVIIDYYSYVIESDENNNENTISLLTLAPDLIVRDITWTPADAAVGDTVTFTVTVRNQGDGRAEVSRVAFYVSGGYQGYLSIPEIEANTEVAATFSWQATGGTHSIVVIADCDSRVVESREENNRLAKTIPIIPPDMIIQDISWTPENPAIGDTVTFTVTVQNQGGGKAENPHVAYYIDDIIMALDPVFNLTSGTSVNTTYSWRAENGLHIFRAFIDYSNRIIESNEDNNKSSVTIIPNMPDLAIGTVTWTPLDTSAGREITFNVNIENRGLLKSGPSRVTYYVDGVNVGYSDIGQLEADATVTERLIWVTTADFHTIEIVADSNDRIVEIDEANNTKVVTLPPPDLVIQDITWSPLEATIDDTVTFTVTFLNQGTSKTQNSQATCYFNELTVAFIDMPEIEPAASISLSFDWVAEAGTHAISITADTPNTVTESDETNNDIETVFSTMTPELIIQDISWLMEQPLLNDDVTFIVTINNDGSYPADVSQMTYSIDESPEVYRDIEPIPAGETAILTFVLTLESGEHTIDVAIDVNEDVTEIDETNNEAALTFNTTTPDLVIKTISWTPVGALPGDAITFTVNAENRGRDKAVNPRLTLYIDGSLVGYVDIDEIDTGATVTGEFSWTAEAGLHEISVLADVDELVPESNETNNSRSQTLTIEEPEAPAKPVPTPLTGPPTSQGFLGSSWWMILLAAALLGGGAFIAAFKSFRKS